MSETEKRRAMSIGPQDVFLLDQWGDQLRRAFGEMPYLVGSVARGARDWRDVDIRMTDVLNLYEDKPMALRVINLSISLWGRQVTGLPIDFQMQPFEEFHSYDGEIRNPMGARTHADWQLERRPRLKAAQEASDAG